MRRGAYGEGLKEYFGEVRSSDAYAYGYGEVRDYLAVACEANAVDWVITNPPFRLAEEFVQRSLIIARASTLFAIATDTFPVETSYGD